MLRNYQIYSVLRINVSQFILSVILVAICIWHNLASVKTLLNAHLIRLNLSCVFSELKYRIKNIGVI